MIKENPNKYFEFAPREEYFQNFEVDFDTRNFTIHNNFEYLDIIPKTNEQFKLTDQVHKDRNYVI